MTKAEKAIYDKNRYPQIREKKSAYSKQYRVQNLEKIRERDRIRTSKVRFSIFEAIGAFCAHCGFSDKRALQIDHINGGGNVERKKFSNAWGFRKHVMANLDKYQILCANCNWIKRWEKGEHNAN